MHGARLAFSLAGMGTRAPPEPGCKVARGPGTPWATWPFSQQPRELIASRRHPFRGSYVSLLSCLGQASPGGATPGVTPYLGMHESTDELQIRYFPGWATPEGFQLLAAEGAPPQGRPESRATRENRLPSTNLESLAYLRPEPLIGAIFALAKSARRLLTPLHLGAILDLRHNP
jgi:hypothetical protein